VKVLNVGGHQLEALVSFFNLTNSSTVISENDEFGSPDNGEQLPNIIMQPRILRVAMQWKF